MKRGFTLVELLAVIVLILTLTILTTVSVNTILKNTKNKLSDTQKQIIEDATGLWIVDNLDNIPDAANNDTCVYMTFGDLKNYGAIESVPLYDITDSDDAIIRIDLFNGKRYEITVDAKDTTNCNQASLENKNVEIAKETTTRFVDGLKTSLSSNLSNSLCIVNNGEVACDIDVINYRFSGTKPTNGYVKFENGNISNYKICMMNYVVTKESSSSLQTIDNSYNCNIDIPESQIIFNGIKESAKINETHKGIVYLDPSNLANVCNSSNHINITAASQKEGCIKFFIYNDDGITYKMIPERNVFPSVQWIAGPDYLAAGGTSTEWTTDGTRFGPVTANNVISSELSNWVGNPRLISSNEIAHISGGDKNPTIMWDDNNSFGSVNNITFYFDNNQSSTNVSKYDWLYNYLSGCLEYGCRYSDETAYSITNNQGQTSDYKPIFYWTSSPVLGNPKMAYVVRNTGSIVGATTNLRTGGIRPVIEIPKYIIDK